MEKSCEEKLFLLQEKHNKVLRSLQDLTECLKLAVKERDYLINQREEINRMLDLLGVPRELNGDPLTIPNRLKEVSPLYKEK